MVRSATAIFAVLILSGFAWLQQVATHTVVLGDTLWDLAQTYYQNPWDWRRIYEANRDSIADPNLIYPGEVFVIPGRQATVTDVQVEGAAPPRAPQPPPAAAQTRGTRTIFYEDTTASAAEVFRATMSSAVAVPRDAVYSAPWLVRLGEVPEHVGTMAGFAGGANSTTTPRSYDRVRLSIDGAAPRVGDRLLVYRTVGTIESVGHVVEPTGIVTVSDVEGGVTAIVTREYGRVQFGDLVGPLPAYSMTPGVVAGPAADDGTVAMIMGFAGVAQVRSVESIAFLDLGSDGGVEVGDEFSYVNEDAGGRIVEGRLQVVGVRPGSSSARIVQLDDVVFEQGLVVRRTGKMP